jgi:shikimate kinase/3-dehydroquinate synthase
VERVERIALIGFSGSGKTTVARLLAARLGWAAADTDVEIERHWGATIPAIFRDHGEGAFRDSERAILGELTARDRVVIATGGGAAVDPSVWASDLLGRPGSLVIALDAADETALDRLRRQAAAEGAAVERPLLAAAEPLAQMQRLKLSRQAAYDAAHLTLATDGVAPEAVAAEIAAVAGLAAGEPLRVQLDAASGSSQIQVAPGALAHLAHEIRARWPKAQRVWVVTDAHVGAYHAGAAERVLRDGGVPAATYTVAPGEGSKSLGTAAELYDWLLHGGVERGDVIVALGGGVVGDLAGFVAATVLRGIGLVQVPTTLLATVDSSVGGKTGINHAAGKNLIGAFLQPPVVLVDTDLLQTVPERDLRSGWAEVVKHAVIQRSTPGGERGDLETILRRNAAGLLRLAEPATAYVIWRNIALKAAVVAADEREAGIRAYLNFGHTLGHAIEAADYQLLHGEAVALGMRAAAELGVACGTCTRDYADSVLDLISLYDLPRRAPLDDARVLGLLSSDKKRVAGKQRFVLPVTGSGVVIRDDVPAAAVARALASVSAEPAVRS